MNKQKGFTIIELLVVIAIIAVLAAIVLVNVTQYIVKGRDAAAQGNLATMLTNGAVFYDATSSFTNFVSNSATLSTGTIAVGTPGNCSLGGDSKFINPCQALVGTVAASGYGITYACGTGGSTSNSDPCGSTSPNVGVWCAQVSLKQSGKTTYCVDSNGNKKDGGACSVAAGTYGFCQ